MLDRYKDLHTNVSFSHKIEHTTSSPSSASGPEILSSVVGSICLRAQSLEDGLATSKGNFEREHSCFSSSFPSGNNPSTSSTTAAGGAPQLKRPRRCWTLACCSAMTISDSLSDSMTSDDFPSVFSSSCSISSFSEGKNDP